MPRIRRPAKQYLAPDTGEVWFMRGQQEPRLAPSEKMGEYARHQLTMLTRDWTNTEGRGWLRTSKTMPSETVEFMARWDRDPTYFAPSGRGNQLREYRLPQQGRKSVRGKTKPTTDDLLSLI